MTIMVDDDEDSDCLVIDEQVEPASTTRQKTDENSTEAAAPVTNKKASELRNIRKQSAELPPVNYLPLMRNHTLDIIKNNIIKASEKPRITIKDFARIETNLNETNNSALYALLTGNKATSLADLGTAVSMDEALRAEAQKNDPRVAETWIPSSIVCKAIPVAPDQGEPTENTIYIYMDTPHDFSVPRIPNAYGEIPRITPNAYEYEIPNGKLQSHTPRAPTMNDIQASVIVPNSGNSSGGTMTYLLSNQTRNENTYNFPTANNLASGPVQHDQTQYMAAYSRPHTTAPPEYNQATAKYNIAQPAMNCPLGYACCRPPMNMPVHPLNLQPQNPRKPPPPYMYAMGMTCNGQRLASTNSSVIPNPYNVPCNGYGQYGTNSVPINTPYGHVYGSISMPQNAPHGGRDNAAYLAEMHRQAYLHRKSFRMEAMKTETTHVVSSAHANQKPGVHATKKRTYTKTSSNKTQVVMNNSEIPTSYNAMGNNAVNIPNWDAFGNEETTAKKRATQNKKSKKVKATIPVLNQVAPSNTEIQPTKNNSENIEISNINLTSECTQTSINNFPKVIQPSLNTETRLSPTIMKVNASNNITTVSHFIDIADEKQTTINKEGNLKPETKYTNDYDAPTERMEAQKGAMNVNINKGQPTINTELAMMNHNRKEAQIPLILDQEAIMSMTTDKPQIKMTIQKLTNEKLQNGTFIQPPNNNTALTLVDKDNDTAQSNVTVTSKPLFQSSSNTYGVNVTTSTTTQKISHNIERNEALRSNAVNTVTDSIQDVEKASSIMNTVDYRTETRVTTVEVVNHISNISVETLRDILNKVQVHSNPSTIVDQAGDHKTRKNERKQDEKLESARKNLARLRETENKNEDSSYKHVENITQKNTKYPFPIKITIGPNGEYIVQVIPNSNDGSFVEDENIQLNIQPNTEQISKSNDENNSYSQRIQETEVLDRNQSIENSQEINATSGIRESIRNGTYDEANRSIDETIFFKFQINFFRLVQERLSENNCQELANQLMKDIYDLIAISDDEGAKADMKYKCHVCRNIAIYSPRSLYYEVTNHLEHSFYKTQNCPRCITFRKKYVDVLIKYMEIEAPMTYSENNPNVFQRDVASVNTTDVRQSGSGNSLHNQEDSKNIRQTENSDIENQLSLITNDEPSSPKQAKFDDQARPNAEHVFDVSKATQDGKTNDFVVKLPRNRLKESTVQALMQNKSDRDKSTLNIATDNKRNQAISSGNRVPSCFSINAEIVSNKNNATNNNIKERGLEVGKIIDIAINRMYSNNNNAEPNPRKIMERISAQDAAGTKSEEQNRNTNLPSDKKEGNDKNQPLKIWRRTSAETTASTNKDPQSNNTNKLLNNNEDIVGNREKHPKKRTSVDAETATGVCLEPKSKNANVTPNDDGHTEKSREKHRKIAKNIVKTASINNSGHDTNQEKHRKMKNISAETISCAKLNNTVSLLNSSDHNIKNKEGNREGQNITYEERPIVTTNTSNDKHNDNNSVRNRELSESIDKETSSISITTISSNTTNTELNKNESANAPKATTAITEKDYVSKGYENRENKEKTRNNIENDDPNDGRKASTEKHDQSGDKDIQTVEKALDDSLKTLKENSNLKDELPRVKISGKKRNKKSTKSKKLKSFDKLSNEYRCRVCAVTFTYMSACLTHMSKNHNIKNPVVPLNCIARECAFCDQYVYGSHKLYNNHIITAHSDINSLKVE